MIYLCNMERKIIEWNSLVVNHNTYVVTYNNKHHTLPKKEFDTLSLLVSKPSNIFTREQILNLVWGSDACVVDRTVDVHIAKLRKKFGNDLIRSVKGRGYGLNQHCL